MLRVARHCTRHAFFVFSCRLLPTPAAAEFAPKAAAGLVTAFKESTSQSILQFCLPAALNAESCCLPGPDAEYASGLGAYVKQPLPRRELFRGHVLSGSLWFHIWNSGGFAGLWTNLRFHVMLSVQISQEFGSFSVPSPCMTPCPRLFLVLAHLYRS